MKALLRPQVPVLAGNWILLVALATSQAMAMSSTPTQAAVGQEPTKSSQEDEQKATEEPEWPYISPALEPADGKWLVDEEGEYYIDRYPRVEGQYSWMDEEKTIVKMRHLPAVKVWKADDAYFYFRIAKQVIPDLVDRSGASPEDFAAVAATYPGSPEERDRYQFVPFEQGLPKRGQWRNGFDFADMNGDGHLDIVHSAMRKGGARPHIFLGSGSGEWRLWEEAQYPDLRYDYGDVAAADLNGDGHVDLALAVHLRGLLVLLGDSKGTFREFNKGLVWAPVKGRTSRSFSSRAITTVDWDKDGRLDLVALSEGATGPQQLEEGVDPPPGKVVYLNRGDHWESLSGPDEDPTFGDHILAVDLDADGRQDLVTDSRYGGNKGLLNYGTEDGLWEIKDLEQLRPLGWVWAVAAADLNGDGRMDLAVSYHTTELGERREGIDIFFGEGKGRSWRRHGLYSNEGQVQASYWALTTGDLDGDGHVDVVAIDTKGGTIVFMGGEGETWFRETSPELAAPTEHAYCVGYRTRMADLDQDGDDELVAVFAGEPGSEAVKAIGKRCPSRGAIRAWDLRPVLDSHGD